MAGRGRQIDGRRRLLPNLALHEMARMCSRLPESKLGPKVAALKEGVIDRSEFKKRAVRASKTGSFSVIERLSDAAIGKRPLPDLVHVGMDEPVCFKLIRELLLALENGGR